MMFYELMNDLNSLKDEAVIEKFRSVLNELAKIEDVNIIKDILYAMAGDVEIYEENDGFGTEGMRL